MNDGAARGPAVYVASAVQTPMGQLVRVAPVPGASRSAASASDSD